MRIFQIHYQFISGIPKFSGELLVACYPKYLFGAILSLIFFLMGCNSFPNAKVPMVTINYMADEEENSRCCLMVLLHGRNGHAKDFEREGFIHEVRKKGLLIDIAAVEAPISYYLNRNIVTRMKEDIIGPAKEKGYEQIWIAGISMGGLGALLYMREHPEDISGVLLFAPYLGENSVINEITEAGGVRKWEPRNIDKDDWERDLWFWIKRYTENEENVSHRLYLAYGENDIFVNAHTLLSQEIPTKQVFVTKGNHDWPTWKLLWSDFLQIARFPKRSLQ